jgi:hypothetical protein
MAPEVASVWGFPPRLADRAGRLAQAVLRLLAVLPLLSAVPPGVSASPAPAEAEVKAAFMLNFIRFVEWPPSTFRTPDDPIVVAVAGKDPVSEAIARLDGKAVAGRRLEVRRIEGAGAAGSCQVLFVGSSGRADPGPFLRTVQHRPVLTVADFDGFVARGGTIGFTRQGERVGFEINEEAAKASGLKVNARLLYLGRPAHPGNGGRR